MIQHHSKYYYLQKAIVPGMSSQDKLCSDCIHQNLLTVWTSEVVLPKIMANSIAAPTELIINVDTLYQSLLQVSIQPHNQKHLCLFVKSFFFPQQEVFCASQMNGSFNTKVIICLEDNKGKKERLGFQLNVRTATVPIQQITDRLEVLYCPKNKF